MSVLKKILSFLVNGLLAVLAAFGLDSPNRIVVALAPVFVAAAGWVAAEIANLLPGLPHLSPDTVTAVFIAGALFATTKILLWLHGWQLSESRSAVTTTPETGPSAGPVHEVGT